MKKILSFILAVLLSAGILATGAFAAGDGISSWAEKEVNAASAAGLVPDSLMKNFTSPVTRGQVAGMFVRLIEKSYDQPMQDILAAKGVSVNEGVFSDTTDINVFYANALGIINGTGQGKFSPDGTLKRAQIAAIINRAAKVMGIATEGYTHEFTDITENYSWADPELGWPVHAGVINGVGNNRFSPGGDLTTEQAIVITYRALRALTEGRSYADGISPLFRGAMGVCDRYFKVAAEYHEALLSGETEKAAELEKSVDALISLMDARLTTIDGYMMTSDEETMYIETTILGIAALRESEIKFGGPSDGSEIREDFKQTMEDYVTMLEGYYDYFDSVRDGSGDTAKFSEYFGIFGVLNSQFSTLKPQTKAEADLNLETLTKIRTMIEEHN